MEGGQFGATAPTPTQPAAVQPVAPQGDTQPSATAEPEQMKDRTRENFEKLLESNQRLYEQNEIMRQEIHQRLGQPEKSSETPQAVQTPSQTPAQSEWDFYETDPKTGETFINRDKLNRTMKDIQEKAKRAEISVQSLVKTNEQREIERQNKETFDAYPELNPENKDKFNKQLHLQVQGLLYSSFISPDQFGGHSLTFKEAADLVQGSKPTQPGAQPASAKAEAGDALKEAGAAQVTSQPQNPTTPSNDEDLLALRFATRMGSDEALARRLMHTEHILAGDAAGAK
jgi:hypothetical protein